MRRIAQVLVTVGAVLALGASSASAEPTLRPADAVASGSLGSQRAVAWAVDTVDARGGAVYFQRLNIDGSVRGSAFRLQQGQPGGGGYLSVFGEVTASMSPTGTLVGYNESQTGRDAMPYSNAVFYFFDNDGSVRYATSMCGRNTQLEGERSIAAAWNGQRYLIASGCPSDEYHPAGLEVHSYDPATDETQRWFAPDTGAALPSIAAVGSTFAVAWQRIGPTGDLDVRVRRFTSSGQPLGPIAEAATGSGDQSQPAIGASGSSFLVAWVGPGTRSIIGRRYEAGTLGAPRTLATAAGKRNHPRLAPSTNGSWHLVWSDLRSGNADVYAAQVSSGLGVTPAAGAIVAGGAGPQRAPTVSPLPNGRAYVAFLDGPAKVRDLTAQSAPAGAIRPVSYRP